MGKYKIGYTAGVFDLFHIGHLNILKKAKEECEYLIVGVTTDELLSSYKGIKAMIPFHERIEIVESIKFVDRVIPQQSMNKMEIWMAHKFNAMFVGSDWKGTDKWNQIEKDFSNVGVDIVYFPYTTGTSSTEIRKLINGKIESLTDPKFHDFGKI